MSCPDLHADAISVDALVNLKRLQENSPPSTPWAMSSTALLEFGDPGKVVRNTERLVRDGVNISRLPAAKHLDGLG